MQAQEEIRRSRSQVTQASAELNREAAATEDAERQPLSQKSMNKAEARRAKAEASKPKGWGVNAVSGLFKPETQPDTFSLDGGSLTLHEPPSMLRATEPETDEQLLQVKVTRILLRSYFSIVRASLVDTVPKAVMHFLVNAVQRGLQQHLIRMLYRDDLFGELLREQPELAQHRLLLSERLSALNEAVHALQDVPEELRRSN